MNVDTAAESIIYTVAERNIYGSDRVGMYTYADTVYPLPPTSTAAFQPVWRGHRKYELKNHLGNVMSVINGHKIPFLEDGNLHYSAQIEAAYDYSPFGVLTRQMENPLISEGGTTNTLEADYRGCFDVTNLVISDSQD